MDKSYTEPEYMPASRKDNQQEKVDSFFGKPGILSIANKCIYKSIFKSRIDVQKVFCNCRFLICFDVQLCFLGAIIR